MVAQPGRKVLTRIFGPSHSFASQDRVGWEQSLSALVFLVFVAVCGILCSQHSHNDLGSRKWLLLLELEE